MSDFDPSRLAGDPPAANSPPPVRRPRWRFWLAVLGAFIAGVAVGAALTAPGPDGKGGVFVQTFGVFGASSHVTVNEKPAPEKGR
jgi:hypothetical protein